MASRRKGPTPHQLLQAGREAARQIVVREPARQRGLRDQELLRLREYEQRARALQEDAAEQLQMLVLSPGAHEAADYVYRLSTHLLGRIVEARWALQQLQQPVPDQLTLAQCRQIADAALLEIERLRTRGNTYLQLEELERVRKFDPRRRRDPGPDRLDRLLDEIVRPAAAMTWKDVLPELERRANPADPQAVIARVEDKHLWWRPQVGGRPRAVSFARLRNRLTSIKDHLAD